MLPFRAWRARKYADKVSSSRLNGLNEGGCTSSGADSGLCERSSRDVGLLLLPLLLAGFVVNAVVFALGAKAGRTSGEASIRLTGGGSFFELAG